MKFRLVYEGPIPPRRRADVAQIHNIRMAFHPQIKALWRYPPLSGLTEWLSELPPGIKNVADYYIWERVNDVLVSPLISKNNHLRCELDITLLRQQPPGQLLGEGGDIDNRMKTLFDALRIPSKAEAQQAKIPKRADGDPIHCLLQDDNLVTRINVETDRLLRPANDEYDLVAIIQVTIVLTMVTYGTIGLLS